MKLANMSHPKEVENAELGLADGWLTFMLVACSATGLAFAIGYDKSIGYPISILCAAIACAVWFLPKYFSQKKSKAIVSTLLHEEELERLKMIKYILMYEKHDEGLRLARFKLEATEYGALVIQYEALTHWMQLQNEMQAPADELSPPVLAPNPRGIAKKQKEKKINQKAEKVNEKTRRNGKYKSGPWATLVGEFEKAYVDIKPVFAYTIDFDKNRITCDYKNIKAHIEYKMNKMCFVEVRNLYDGYTVEVMVHDINVWYNSK